ncbi:DUF3841 domain-containing protein [Spirillospora sp. CA-128828]|uniref:DUF3841 domain-containing protein n=1 Tax=Spirillospora sp. CA-128828 TaxID=3240033 RepID=UPI003D90AFA8
MTMLLACGLGSLGRKADPPRPSDRVRRNRPVRLWTVQHSAVLDSLETSGESVGDWARLPVASYRPVYDAMVAEMARRGLDCRGLPPVWAWLGPDTRDNAVAVTAESLLCPETDEEYARYVVLDLDVPDEMVLLSSYGRWNDCSVTALWSRSHRSRKKTSRSRRGSNDSRACPSRTKISPGSALSVTST